MPTNTHPRTIIGLGEILWDLLPDGPRLGGAPANFAFHAAQLGNQGWAVSRIGEDEDGDRIVLRFDALGLNADGLQRDPQKPTGTVEVHVGEGGEPHYRIVEDVAWDRLDWSLKLDELSATADAVCFGSLAQRSEQSRKTIRRFLSSVKSECLRVFDVNLRGDFFSREVLSESSRLADIIKLNDDELPQVCDLLDVPYSKPVDQARWLLDRYEMQMAIVTRGAHGSLMIRPDADSEHTGVSVDVKDTIGAGDAFTAAVVHHYLRGADLDTISDRANRLGAEVAARSGATPDLDEKTIESIKE